MTTSCSSRGSAAASGRWTSPTRTRRGRSGTTFHLRPRVGMSLKLTTSSWTTRGLVFAIDRYEGLSVLEFTPRP